MKQQKHLFIVNPKAGKGVATDLGQKIHQLFLKIRERFPATGYEIVYTEYPGHAREIARDYSSRDTWRIYSVGGDGTLNEVLNGMVGSDSTLAVIPGGTGNDFIQYLAGDIRREEFLKETILGDEERVDVAEINGQYFLNIASIGFDALVNYRTGMFKRKPLITSQAAYLGGILSSLFHGRPLSLTVDSGDEVRRIRVFMMTFCNGQVYGSGYRIAPEAKINDGLLDIIEVAPLSIPEIIKYMPMLKTGEHLDQEVINFYRSKRLVVTSDEELLLNIDGESTWTRELDIRLHPGKVSMVFPRTVSGQLKEDEGGAKSLESAEDSVGARES